MVHIDLYINISSQSLLLLANVHISVSKYLNFFSKCPFLFFLIFRYIDKY